LLGSKEDGELLYVPSYAQLTLGGSVPHSSGISDSGKEAFANNSLRDQQGLWLDCPLNFSGFGQCLHRNEGNLEMKRERLHNLYSGRVQGVGFRYSVKTVAAGFEVTGTVKNLTDGRVELVAEGAKTELVEFMQAIRDSDVGGLIRGEETHWSEAKNDFRGFEIIR
jgi:acylphosphatase